MLNEPADLGSYDQGSSGRMPEKVLGKHRWIATAAYTMTEEQISAATSHQEQVFLDHENRVAFSVGCWDCQQPWDQVKDLPCPAEAGADPVRLEVQPDIDLVTDPAENSVEVDPVGSTSIPAEAMITNSTLANGFGVQAVLTGRLDSEQWDARLLVSITGKVNKRDQMIHHLYMLTPEDAGLFAAQMVHGMICLGDKGGAKAKARFEERMEELHL